MGSEFVARKSSVWAKKSDTKPSLFTSRSFSEPSREENTVNKKELPKEISPPNYIFNKIGFNSSQPALQRQEDNSDKEQEPDVMSKSDSPVADEEEKISPSLEDENQEEETVSPQLEEQNQEEETVSPQLEDENKQEELNKKSIQTKLTVGEPGDKYEQEADTVAAKVVEHINSPKSQQPVQGKVEPVVQPTLMRQGGAGGGTVNRDVELIQKSDSETENKSEDEIPHFKLIPPQLRLPFGKLGFSADTSRTQLNYRNGLLNTEAGYKYKGEIFAGMSYRDFITKFGINAKSGAMSFSGSYKNGPLKTEAGYQSGGEIFAGMNYRDFITKFGINLKSGSMSFSGSYKKFRGDTSFNPDTKTFGASLSYGPRLLPMPDELSKAMYAGANGLQGVIGSTPKALDNPLGFHKSQSFNIKAMVKAGKMLRDVASQKDDSNFAAGLLFRLSPEERLKLILVLQGHF